ncbi:ArnT family glycosyltransferase [Kiritimatiella glycovorans]|uniref:Putative membrane protein n=1 Tax=Kiritimatiella glycovorans TaxID=1307763 RepID=A0A0G3EHX9_9BACT|nr:glycosyltransferase family 39 protein [Kiritimatiella glycovorans]AKJ65032.1 putative membrane protein [Kiritimatiella glycovorans]
MKHKTLKYTDHAFFALVLLAAAFVRLFRLGRCAFKGDTINYYRNAAAGTGVFEIWRDYPWHNQVPFTESFMLAFLKVFQLPVNHFTVRLPFALIGIGAVAVLYYFVRPRWGRITALLAALFCAFAPYHVYLSREAYYYAGVVLTSALALWAFWPVWTRALRTEPPDWRAFGLWWAASLLAAHTHMSVWPVFGVQWLMLAWSAFKTHRADRDLLLQWSKPLVLTPLLVAVVLSPWIYRLFTASRLHPPGHEARFVEWLASVAGIVPVMTFGTQWFALLWLLVPVSGVVWTVWRGSEQVRPHTRRLLLLSAFQAVALLSVFTVLGKGYPLKHTYCAPLFAPVAVLTAIGIAGWGSWLTASRKTDGRIVAVALAAVCVALWLVPVRANVNLPGKTKMFRYVERWFESNAREQTPLVVADQLTAIQMSAAVPEKAYLTFLSPQGRMSDPEQRRKVQAFRRERLREMMDRFPSAMYVDYLDHAKMQHPGESTWNPREFFAHTVVFTNREALTLRRWGVAPRPDFYGEGTEGMITRIHYNKAEDLAHRAAAQETSLLPLYGEGWSYVKTRDLRDWAILGSRATLRVLNGGDQPRRVNLSIEAVPLGGMKTITLSDGAEFTFENRALGKWVTEAIEFAPGTNRVTLTDASPATGDTRPLLIRSISFE